MVHLLVWTKLKLAMNGAVGPWLLHVLVSQHLLIVLLPRLHIGAVDDEVVVIDFTIWAVELGDVELILLRCVVRGLGHRVRCRYRLVLSGLC